MTREQAEELYTERGILVDKKFECGLSADEIERLEEVRKALDNYEASMLYRFEQVEYQRVLRKWQP